MKLFKYINIALLMGGAMTMVSCQNDFDDPGLQVPEATLKANISISEFKEIAYTTDAVQLTDDNSLGDYVIKGRVISSDATGNIYQSLVIQDETAAMPITIRRASLFTEYHLGQEIVVDTRGLWLGKYNGLIQLGWLGEPYNGTPQLTFMSFAEFQAHAQLNGLPEIECAYIEPNAERPEKGIYCQVLDIDNLPTSGAEMYNLQGQLVEFRNVSFDGGGELTYAPYQESVNRYIKAQNGSLKLTVRNSGYATFYNSVLPTGTGTVRGILSWYGDGSSSTDGVIGGWQLLLRSLNDVMFDTKGSAEDPYSIEEARTMQNDQRSGWVSGYIIGSVKAGVSTLTSVDEIIFGENAEINNNVVIATTATTRDLDDMMVVNLPQGSALRSEINLQDNPSVLGRVLKVNGELTNYLGFPGVVGSGNSGEFLLAADNEGPSEPVVGGAGTLESPFSVAQVISSTSDTVDAWVEGYVVGYVNDKAWPDDCVFDNTPSETNNYVNCTNIILSDSPVGSASVANSIPVALSQSVRGDLGLARNPEIYGKKVKLKGNVTKYFGIRGLKAVSEYVEL